ncbi:IS3 family transposase [Desulfovibrio sp. JC022]|uniref:IS3 family transposase n=1 Tax=Desulfovibrio sp. JC022 TaxID=2593642 RepID=UPI0013D70E8A|nr:IS3 family transposase [Desulfovibrio sp. JC022]
MPSEQQKRRDKIRQAASASYRESDGVYGYRKVHEDVIETVGFYCCPETVRRVLAAKGMKSQTVRRHRYTKTHRDEHYAPNLLSREFTANAPNEKWVPDITYIPTGEGWLYLVIVQDILSTLEFSTIENVGMPGSAMFHLTNLSRTITVNNT